MNTNSKILVAITAIMIVSFFVYQSREHKKEMERLAWIEKNEKDKRDWERAERINTIAAYQQYKSNNTLGNYLSEADEAIERLKEIERRRIEYEERKKKVFHLAKLAGDQIIRKAYQNGTNKNTIVNNWSYQKGYLAGKGTYTVDATLTWNGDWITSNYYKASGTIVFKEDGSELKWTPTYVNPTLAKYMDDMKGTILGAVIILGTLEALSE